MQFNLTDENLLLSQKIGQLLANCVTNYLRMTAIQGRHDARVRNPQVSHTTYTQFLVNDR